MSRPRVVVLRGHDANPWDLGIWERLRDRYDVEIPVTGSNRYDVSSLAMRRRPVKALRDFLPGGPVGEFLTGALRDRYFGLSAVLEGASIVHAAELGSWFSPLAARLKRELAYRLVLTVWETIPLGEAYRPRRIHAQRAEVLAATDLFVAPTRRARDALVLEGVEPDRVVVSAPGIDLARFRAAADAPPSEHLVVSAGRLVWEKGHQDVIRAVALVRRELAGDGIETPRVVIVGNGPERERLLAHAAELGVGDLVQIRSVPYEEMARVFAEASCMVLASLPRAFSGPVPGDTPRNYWEEQFGMVLAEAMAAGAPILAAASGAIPEVTRGQVELFPAGDWQELARLLVDRVLPRPPGERVAYDPGLLELYSVEAAAERIAVAYERVLASPSSLTASS